MKAVAVFTLIVSVLAFSGGAVADDRPIDFDFSFTTPLNPTGGPFAIPDNEVRWYPLLPSVLATDPDAPILYLELIIEGLSHDAPMDLNLILLDPFGTIIEPFGAGVGLMDDAGDQIAVAGIDLLFADKNGIALPHGTAQGPLLSFPDTIYLPDGPGSFAQYYDGRGIGTDPWFLVVIDDAVGQSGSFESATLRGVVVPEPMTLTLLAIGAVATLRRRRH